MTDKLRLVKTELPPLSKSAKELEADVMRETGKTQEELEREFVEFYKEMQTPFFGHWGD